MPAAQSDGVRHVLVLEPTGARLPPRPQAAASESAAASKPGGKEGRPQMIMPRRNDPLLLPVSPLFVWTTLAVAFLLNIVPLGRVPAMPDFLALVLVFWNVHQSRRIGVGVAFFFGLLMDVHSGAVLGQHALAYTLLSFFAVTIHRRLLWFTVPSQAVQILPLFLAAQAVSLVVHLIAGGMFPGWELILAPVFQALLWPVATWLLARSATPRPRPGRESAPVTELRNTEREIARFRLRLVAAALFVLIAFGLLASRLAYLQVSKHDELSTQAENNRIAVVPITPNRGLILDRNGVVLANNYSAYTLEICAGQGQGQRSTRRSTSWPRSSTSSRATGSASSACSTRAAASSRCRSGRASTTRRSPASRRRSSASRASRSRRGSFAAIRSARSAAT